VAVSAWTALSIGHEREGEPRTRLGIMTRRHFIPCSWLAAICCVGLYGCGGSGAGAGQASGGAGQAGIATTRTAASAGVLPTGAVASVQGNSVTEAALDHWVAVQAATNYEAVPKGPVPAGVVPDPPGFRACIAYLRSGGQNHEGVLHARSNAQLLAECEVNYRRLRAHVLGILISFKWWEAEAKALGISFDQEKVAKAFARFRDEEYHSIPNYERYLRTTGQTLADEYLRMRMDLYTVALGEHFQAEGTPAMMHYLRDFSKEWAAKTSCQPADVVPNCKEYKGSSAPEARI
jgi:hypothetical protein